MAEVPVTAPEPGFQAATTDQAQGAGVADVVEKLGACLGLPRALQCVMTALGYSLEGVGGGGGGGPEGAGAGGGGDVLLPTDLSLDVTDLARCGWLVGRRLAVDGWSMGVANPRLGGGGGCSRGAVAGAMGRPPCTCIQHHQSTSCGCQRPLPTLFPSCGTVLSQITCPTFPTTHHQHPLMHAHPTTHAPLLIPAGPQRCLPAADVGCGRRSLLLRCLIKPARNYDVSGTLKWAKEAFSVAAVA